jgi:hypothetical protein
MYLAPLNYQRFFEKVFSEERIARKFLEDFLEVEIQEFQPLKEKHRISDDASTVEFDFRCKIKDSYVIIDMQQWYKPDIVQRFFLYHTLNTALQLEDIPLKRFPIPGSGRPGKYKRIKDYRLLEPVYTLIWMVMDTLKFTMDYISYLMAPEILVDFLKDDRLWREPEIKKLLEERKRILEVVEGNTRNIDFLPKNRLIFMFQKNIVKNKALKKYERWFEFAEKTRNESNEEKDFKEYKGDEIFSEMIRRLRKDTLTDADFDYIADEKKAWEEVERLERGFYEDGIKDGKQEGIKEGIKEGIEKGIKEGRTAGAKDKALEMAKNALKEGLSIELISKLTGLSNEEIDKLK